MAATLIFRSLQFDTLLQRRKSDEKAYQRPDLADQRSLLMPKKTVFLTLFMEILRLPLRIF
jgi:hypothetical protein